MERVVDSHGSLSRSASSKATSSNVSSLRLGSVHSVGSQPQEYTPPASVKGSNASVVTASDLQMERRDALHPASRRIDTEDHMIAWLCEDSPDRPSGSSRTSITQLMAQKHSWRRRDPYGRLLVIRDTDASLHTVDPSSLRTTCVHTLKTDCILPAFACPCAILSLQK